MWLSAALCTAALVQAREPSLREVLSRAGDYAADYHQAMATAVAEEQYTQTLRSREGSGPPTIEHRTLISDFLIVSGAPGEPSWMAFRDVLEVDGTAVRDHEDRLQRLFASGGDAVDRALAISRESARYNLGRLVRTINVPIVALDFLLPATRGRFGFHKDGRVIDARGQLLWDVSFSERDRPTIIKTPSGKDIVARGSFLIDPVDGRVVQTTLDVKVAKIVVQYEIEPRLQISVPVKMTESYQMPQETLEAVAIYSNFRRFETGARIVPR
jgi:hypothetical protein